MGVRESRRRFLKHFAAGGSLALGGISGCVGQITGGSESVRFGSILPTSLSGELGTVGSHGVRAIEQAVADVNRAGGPLDREIEFLPEDSGADTDRALDAYESLREEGTIGFVGGLLSEVSLELVEEVPGECMQVSSASTHPSLASKGYADETKYFARTVPSDVLQAVVMVKILQDAKYVGADAAAVLHVDDSFGAGLADRIESLFDGTVTATVPYDPDADAYGGVLDEAFADDPDGVALVATPGTTEGLMTEWADSEYDAEWVLSAGLLSDSPAGYFRDAYSASIRVEETDGALRLRQQLRDVAPLAPFTENAYDALFLQALAVERAGEATPEAIAENIEAVSAGPGHTVTVGEFDRAKSLLRAGREVTYQGAAGSVGLNERLEPLSPYVVEQVEGRNVVPLELVHSSYFEGRAV
ncbi:ABC transporter substrate-binding protein [Halorussus salilacus]|uniref:ABC transporter substrate-binding protein n=1 Tax=Halorussus salilacus TaxID=2953750 RepID=UPI0020A231DD|nr:ABC transporter substrate-binding protein [Halorussus salilacus]USZ68393.1 ABC transporter substrate-binding protein [Halorussus salilacus]